MRSPPLSFAVSRLLLELDVRSLGECVRGGVTLLLLPTGGRWWLPWWLVGGTGLPALAVLPVPVLSVLPRATEVSELLMRLSELTKPLLLLKELLVRFRLE